MAPPNEPETRFFQHYEILTRPDGSRWELGRGAMGVTYKARDVNLDTPVALKIINARFSARPEARRRFLHEAQSAARLRHPNVASVFHFGTSNTLPAPNGERGAREPCGRLLLRDGIHRRRIARDPPAAQRAASACLRARDRPAGFTCFGRRRKTRPGSSRLEAVQYHARCRRGNHGRERCAWQRWRGVGESDRLRPGQARG